MNVFVETNISVSLYLNLYLIHNSLKRNCKKNVCVIERVRPKNNRRVFEGCL